jgi:hypothetical protein
LSDARTTTAAIGAPVMEVVGSDAIAGNVMWLAPLSEVAANDEVGGKGGPSQQQTTYSYFQGIALGICRGPMGGIVRIWENGALVFDVRGQQESESDSAYAARLSHAQSYADGFVFYPGDEEQMPDPTIEADKGVGFVPAFRGLCYIVFPNRQLKEEQGLRHPNFKIEVTRSFVGACNLQFSNEVLFPWVDDPVNPENPLNTHLYSTGIATAIAQPTSDLATLLAQSSTASGFALKNVPLSYQLTQGSLIGDYVDSKTITLAGGYPYAALDRIFNFTENDAVVTIAMLDAASGQVCDVAPYQGIPGTIYYDTPTLGGGLSQTLDIPGTEDAPSPAPPFGDWESASRCADSGFYKQDSVPMVVHTTRQPSAPGDDTSGWSRIDGHLYRVLQTYSQGGGPGGRDRLPLNPCLPLGDENFDDATFWTDAYNAAVTAGTMAAGLTYAPPGGSGDYPVEQTWAYVRGGVPHFDMTAPTFLPWLLPNTDPRNPANEHLYETDDGAQFDDYADAQAALTFLGSPTTVFGGIRSWGTNPDRRMRPYVNSDPLVTDPQKVVLSYARQDAVQEIHDGIDPDATLCEFLISRGILDNAYWWHGGRTDGETGFGAGVYGWVSTIDLAPPLTGSSFSCGGGGFIWVVYDAFLVVRRTPIAPVDDGLGAYLRSEGRAWRWLADDTAEVTSPADQMITYPQGPARPTGHPQYADSAFWTDAYDAAVDAGDIPAGATYGGSYPIGQTYAYVRVRCDGGAGDVGVISLAEVIEYLCGRCGIGPEEIDTTDLEEIFIVGYTVTRQMTGRDAIEPLRNVGFFDTVESGELLKFVARGKPPVRTIGIGDFAHESGQEPGPDITTNDKLESDLPRTVRIHYKAPSRDYEDGEQISPSRSTVKAVNDADLEVAVSMSDDLAAKIAEVVWADSWEGRRSHGFQLDAYHADLEASDVVSLPVDGYLQRVRLGAVDETIAILRKFESSRDYDGNYVSRAVADPPSRRPGEIIILSPSEIIFLDLPALRDTDNDPGVYATTIAQDEGATWKGAAVYKSTDDGATFNFVAGTSNKPTVGSVLNAIPAGDSHGFDTRYTLDVEVEVGSLESRTESAIFGGANTIAVGAEDRWELIQFANVEQLTATTYRLSRLVRGRKGTEWAMGTMQVGDRFVLVSGAGIIRLPIVNAEIGIDLQWKAVTFGMEYNTGIDATFASHAEALRPYSPVDVTAEPNESGDLVISWLRRGRLGHELTSGTEIPLSEATEAYEIDILSGSDVVRTLTSTTTSVTYPVAEQVADFGPDTTAIDACVYQMSAVVGRGHPGCMSDTVDANEVEGSLEALPFIPAYDDQPCLIGTTSEGFIFTRRGTKGEEDVVGFYFWPAAGSPPGDIAQFDDNYDGGGTDYFPSSYFQSANVQNNFVNGEEVPTHGFDRSQAEFSLYWRQNPSGASSAQKWLISGDGDTTLKIVPRASTPLSSTTRNVNALLPVGSGVIYALASEISIAPTNKPDVYKSTDGGATWTFIATTTGDIPAFEWLAPLRLFKHAGKVHLMTGFGNYVNAAADLIDWDDQGASPTTALVAMRAGDPIAAIIDFDYTATEIVVIGFSASSWSSGGGYVGQTQRIIRSTDGGATWSVNRAVAMSSDIAPGFAYPIDWQLIRKFGAGYIVYGKALTAFAFPWALVSTDGGVTWGTAQHVDTGDVTGNAVIQSALSDGSTIFAVDTFGRRQFNASNEYSAGADPITYGRLSYSTDGLTFSALPGFPTA